jgi:hypothetical protein
LEYAIYIADIFISANDIEKGIEMKTIKTIGNGLLFFTALSAGRQDGSFASLLALRIARKALQQTQK